MPDNQFTKETEIKRNFVLGFYSPAGYNIWLSEDGELTEQLYDAGNSPYDSTSVIDGPKRVPVDTLKLWCDSTGEEFATDMGIEYLGSSLEA